MSLFEEFFFKKKKFVNACKEKKTTLAFDALSRLCLILMKLSMYDRFVVTCLNLLLSCVIKAINCEAFVEEKEVVSRMPTSADRRLEIMSALDHSRESFDRPLFRRPRPTSVHSDLISSMVVGSTSDEWINDSGPFDVAAKSTGRVTAKDHRVDLLAGSYVSHRHHRHNSTYFIASSKNRSLADFDKNMTYVPLKKHLNLEVPLGLDPATTEEHQITPGLLGIPIRRRALICPFKVVVDTLFYRHVGSESVGRTMKIVAHYMRYMDNYLRNIDVTGDGFPDNIGIYITELVIYRHGPFDTPSVDIWDPRLFFKELRAYNFRRHCGGLVFTYRNMGSDTVISDGPSLIVTNPQKKYGLGICNSDDAKMVDGIKLDYGSYVTNALPLNFRSLNTTASQSSMEVAVIHQLGHLLGASDDYKTGQCNFGNMHTVHASAFPINPGIGGKRSRNLSVCALQSITDYVKYKGRYCLKLCYEAGCRPFVELPPPILIPSPPTVVTLPPRTIPVRTRIWTVGKKSTKPKTRRTFPRRRGQKTKAPSVSAAGPPRIKLSSSSVFGFCKNLSYCGFLLLLCYGNISPLTGSTGEMIF